uniref:Uncharacterized protein n=1 Tax=Cannabis sativa TaxID=3483 RepID=A0A803NK67_CANSA
MVHNLECFNGNNSNNESFESFLNNEEVPLDKYIEEIEPRNEEKEFFEVAKNLGTLDACSTNEDLNLVNEETSILIDEVIEDQLTVKVVDGHVENEQTIERVFEKNKKDVSLLAEELLVVVDLRLSMLLCYELPMDSYFPLMSASQYYILYELPNASL